ncbi:hypothetical protein [Variibacter gotjawalensis]|uniref:hypothetical protein n=1 Tax=Variibacter gotjawalensis TaxID=1333996 RepID=UPI0012FE786E|nr:hypothetical protein [Variibacter gotjawalensis]NIK45884.1 hypothetical protein [Variibacter gotjawalensis]
MTAFRWLQQFGCISGALQAYNRSQDSAGSEAQMTAGDFFLRVEKMSTEHE